jgi:hypothetical protein
MGGGKLTKPLGEPEWYNYWIFLTSNLALGYHFGEILLTNPRSKKISKNLHMCMFKMNLTFVHVNS